MNWHTQQTSLADKAQFQTLNGLWTGKKPPFANAGVIRNTNFTESGRIDYSDVAWLQVEEKQLSKRQLQPGDIIVERSGGGPKQPVGRVVYFAREDGPFSFSNFTSAIRVRDTGTFLPKFVFYRLLELYQTGRTEDIQSRTTGIRNLDFPAYKERASFPMLPLAEQGKIVLILGLVQRAMAQEERLLGLTMELKSTLLYDLFTRGLRGETQKQTEIGPVPESWRVSRLDAFCVLQRGFDITKKEQIAGGVPVVSSGGIASYHNVAKVKGPGVVVGRKGTLGKVHYVDVDYWPHDTTLWVKDFKGHDPLFTSYFLKTLHFERYNSGASNPTLNRNTVHAEVVAYPQNPEQAEIAKILKTVEDKYRLHERKHIALTALFRTLLHKLMTAQFRVHDLDLSELETNNER